MATAAVKRQRLSGRAAELGPVLERLYGRYNHRRCIAPDPLQFVYRYEDRADREIVGFLASALAYGRVQQIEKSLERLFCVMGQRPSEFVRGFGAAERRTLAGFKHRFNTGEDISELLTLLRRVLREAGGIEAYFAAGYRADAANVSGALRRFSETLLAIHAKDRGTAGKGLRYLLVSPSGGSACKRLNLFLRWMVRCDDVDCGLWSSVDKAKLIVPVDVHMERLCRILGLYSRKTVSLKAAVEITRSFAEIEPDDPVKYDFALSRIGIVEDCDGKVRDRCADCELLGFCKRRL